MSDKNNEKAGFRGSDDHVQMQQQEELDSERNPLFAAVKMADLIHKHMTAQDENVAEKSSWKVTPGIVEGVVAGGGMFLLLGVPRRALRLHQYHPTFDIIYTFGQVILSFQAAFYAGSLYGSWAHLNKFTMSLRDNVEAPSPTATAICSSPIVCSALKQPMEDRPPSNSFKWNPNDWVLSEYQEALKICQQRNDAENRKRLMSEEKKLADSKSNTAEKGFFGWRR